MKSILSAVITIFMVSAASAHGVHPILSSFNKSTEEAYDFALHKVGYSESDFDDLSGIATQQDLKRSIRIVRFNFAANQCSKNFELYFKLDGSAYLAHKVVGCSQ